MFNFFFQFSPPSPDWLPTLRLSPPPLPRVWPRGRQSRWLTWWVGLGGLNEGISRDSSQLKEAFSGEVNGNSVTPSWFPPLQWFLLLHRLLLRPAGQKHTDTDIQPQSACHVSSKLKLDQHGLHRLNWWLLVQRWSCFTARSIQFNIFKSVTEVNIIKLTS